MVRLPNLQRMSDTPENRRFVQIADAIRETNPWTNNEWLCRPDLVEADKLLLVTAGELYEKHDRYEDAARVYGGDL